MTKRLAAIPYRWRVVALLWMVCFCNYADRQALFSVFPLLKTALGLSDAQLGLAGGAFMWAYALCGPFAGWLGDRYSRKRLILTALIFWSCFTAASAIARNLWQLAACRALAGFAEAFYFPAAMSLLGAYHGGATRSRAMAMHQTGVYAGTIAGASAAGWLGQYYGWQSPFCWFGALGLALAALLFLLLREPKRGAAETAPAPLARVLAGVLKNRAARLLILAFIGANFVAAVFLSWLPSYLYRTFSMNLAAAGWNSTAYLQMASVLGVLTGGVAADRLARSWRGARIALQAFALLCGAPFLLLSGWTLSVRLLILATACFGFFKGLYDANIFASLYEVVPVERRASAAGVLNSFGWLGAGFAPAIVGALSERAGLGVCLSATSCVYLACAGLLAAAAVQMRGKPDATPSSTQTESRLR